MDVFYQSPLGQARPYHVGIGHGIFGAHWHSELEILYVLRGQETISIDQTDCLLPVGTAVIVGAAVPHAVTANTEDTLILCVEFGHALLGDGYALLRERTFISPFLDFTDSNERPLEHTLLELTEQVNRNSDTPTDEWLVRSLLFRCATQVAALPHTALASKERTRRLLALQRIQNVLSRLETEYAYPWSISDAAILTGFESKSFCRAFRSVTGRTFHDYLNETRVNAARLLLSEDTLPIALVGEKVGFPEPKTFSRVFLSVTGMTPSAYRALS